MRNLYWKIKEEYAFNRLLRLVRSTPKEPDNSIWFPREGFYSDEPLTEEKKSNITNTLGFYAEIKTKELSDFLKDAPFANSRAVVLSRNDVEIEPGIERVLKRIYDARGLPFLVMDFEKGSLRVTESKYTSLSSSPANIKVQKSLNEVISHYNHLGSLISKHPKDYHNSQTFLGKLAYHALIPAFKKAGKQIAQAIETYNRTLSESMLSGQALSRPRFPITHLDLSKDSIENLIEVPYLELNQLKPGQFSNFTNPGFLLSHAEKDFKFYSTEKHPYFVQVEKGHARCSFCNNIVEEKEENSIIMPTEIAISMSFSGPLRHIAYLAPICKSEKCNETFKGMQVYYDKKAYYLEKQKESMAVELFSKISGRQVTPGQIPSLEEELGPQIQERFKEQYHSDQEE